MYNFAKTQTRISHGNGFHPWDRAQKGFLNFGVVNVRTRNSPALIPTTLIYFFINNGDQKVIIV